MPKLALNDISNLRGNPSAAQAAINANNALLEAAFDNTLSRDGSVPNTMGANLDMNSNRILNLPNAVQNQEPITLAQASSIAGVDVPLTRETIGTYLYPISDAETAAGMVIGDLEPHFYYGDVRRYGAVGDGSTNDATAFTRAVNQAGESKGAAVYIPEGTYKVTSAITLPNVDIYIYGEGTMYTSAAIANGIFYQPNRGVCTTIGGRLKCTGKSPLFKRVAGDSPLPWSDHYLEYRISGVHFAQDSDTYGAHLYGAREGSFEGCYFETCKGVYSDYSINMDFVNCHGKNAVQFVDAQAGSEGIKFIGGSALGMTYCIKATNMIGVQIVGVMWDYCDNPVQLTACQQIVITGSYITSRSTSAHAINIVPDGATRSEDVYIVGNPMIANVAASGTGRGVHLEDVDYALVSGNQIKLWRVVGVYVDGCTQTKVMDNFIIPYPATGTYSIQTATSDSSVVIENNTVTLPIETLTTRSVRYNRGYVTENAGEATLNGGATSRTIAHGLAKAPLKQDVKLTQTSTLGTATEMWVSAVDATNVTVTFDVDPVTNVTVSWSARISPG